MICSEITIENPWHDISVCSRNKT